VTLNYSSDIPLSQLYTGQSSIDKIRGYARYKGSSNIMIWEDFFNGESIIQHYRKPYDNNVHVEGTDGFQFKAELTEEDSIYYFDDFAMRTLKFDFDSKGERGKVSTFRFKIDTNSYAQPKKYPDNINCPMANISAIHKVPLVFALPNYAGCILLRSSVGKDIEMLKGVMIDGKAIGDEKVDLEFEVEPYTGITLGIKYKFEVSMLLII